MKDEIQKQIDEIDEIVKAETGVDLKQLEKQLAATKAVFRSLDLTIMVVGGDLYAVKSRYGNMVH